MAAEKVKKGKGGIVETPLMRQYFEIKSKHPDAVLLFRVGDFYETYGEDAVRASAILGITLTRRANGAAAYVEMAGFPYHAVETYLPKLVRAGQRVAICEQLEDPKSVKGLVKRGVVELVTPGVSLSNNTLNSKENNFLGAVFFGRKQTGVAFLDISTGEFYVGQGSTTYVDKLLSNFAPKEVLFQRGHESEFRENFGGTYYTYQLDEWIFSEELNRRKLCEQFDVRNLKGYGIESQSEGISAAGAILYYLEFTEHRATGHIRSISRIDADKYVWIDKFSIRNLELFASNDHSGQGSLLSVLDRTLSPMGGRLLRHWIALPVKDIDTINERLDVVSDLCEDVGLKESLGEQLALVGDLERLAQRIATGRILPREMIQLKHSLAALEEISAICAGNEHLAQYTSKLDLCREARERIATELYPDPETNQIAKGGIIADGVDAELDDLRRVAGHGKEVLCEIQRRESELTGIPSLRINYNNVFGYYIEVRNTHRDKVPAEWVRKQTLKDAERYITPELKEYEEKILGAEERILMIEQRIYTELIGYLCTILAKLQRNAALIATLDVLHSFAVIAIENNYTRPRLDDSTVIDIRDGRHPVIERLLAVGDEYIPNDLYLDNDRQQIMMITGPNMSGKSAILRQTALIVLMAQMGSFVPASEAHIGVVDKIFTRVGASDNISQGESTFMVEMLESASILNNISNRSLVLLDEIGRGTSTYDGIAIAWAMVEYLHNNPSARPKTLFATHYHELNEMSDTMERIRNYHVAVKEVGKTVVFLRKLTQGGTERSFGVHVARIAGMPRSVVERAEQILNGFGKAEMGGTRAKKGKSKGEVAMPDYQLSMFQLEDPVLVQIRDRIRDLDINSLTPLEALNTLSEIKNITGI